MPRKPGETVKEAEEKLTGEVTGFEYSIFFRGPEGFGEHFKAVATSANDIGAARTALVFQLVGLDAKPLLRDMEFQKTAPAQKGTDQKAGQQWARRDNGPQGTGDECPNGCGPMKSIQNRKHATGRNGTVWNDFMKCDTCQKTKNLKTIGGELPEADYD